MVAVNETSSQQPQEQLRYAAVMRWGARLGFAVLAVSMVALIMGWGDPLIPMNDLPSLWSQSSEHYRLALSAANRGTWLSGLLHPDLAGAAGLVMLLLVCVVGLVAVIPMYLRAGQRWLAWIGIAQLLVMGLAASGMLPGGS